MISLHPVGRTPTWQERIVDGAAGVVLLLAAAVLLGWILNIDFLRRPVPGTVAMNPLTAILFGMAAVAALLLSHRRDEAVWGRVSLGAAWIVCAGGGIIMCDLLAGTNLAIDKILFRHSLEAQALFAGNRMAPNTALNFLITGAGLVLAHGQGGWRQDFQRMTAAVVALFSLAALIGYTSALVGLYGVNSFVPMAVHTAGGFLLLSVMLFLLAREEKETAVMTLAQRASAGRSALEFRVKAGFGVALFVVAMVGIVSYVAVAKFAAQAAVGHATGANATEIADGKRAALIISLGSIVAFFCVAAAATMVKRNLFRRHEAQVLLDNFFILSLDLICLSDRQGRFTHVNPAWGKVLGYPEDELIGRTFADFVHPHDREEMLALAEKLAAGAEAQTFENRFRGRDGTYRWLTWKAILGPDGKTVYGIGRDFTARREAEEGMRRSAAQAAEANESKSRFLANMSHEIRTPMAAIIGYADLLLNPEQSQSDRLDYINTIRRNGEHLLTIINDVLDLSKIEAGKFQVDPMNCCPCQVLSDVASLMRVRAVEKLIRLEVKNEGLIPATIHTDPARLRQVLINLIGNAIKFTEEGWVKLIMRLEEPADGRALLRFDVMDTGIGMSREQIGRLFQPFEQADGSMTRRFGGTGLGLTISKRLAEMLGGRIEVDSSPGRGSTFSLLIDPGDLTGVQRMKNCREALAGSPNKPRNRTKIMLRGRVLLVDDGQDNRRLLSVYLREAGAEVVTAENGKTGSDEALAAAANGQPYGVILMDMQMPELDGYGATSRLRSKGYTGPIVALTAHAMAEDRAKCLKAGCTDYLSKPVRREDLLLTVGKYLNSAETPGGVQDDAAPAAGQTPASDGRLRSTLADESLRPFLTDYVAGLPEQLKELEWCLAQGAMEQLRTKVHNLRGTGGLYGFMSVTDAAAAAEGVMHAKGSVDAIRMEVEKLMAVIRNVEGFDVAAPPSAAQET